MFVIFMKWNTHLEGVSFLLTSCCCLLRRLLLLHLCLNLFHILGDLLLGGLLRILCDLGCLRRHSLRRRDQLLGTLCLDVRSLALLSRHLLSSFHCLRVRVFVLFHCLCELGLLRCSRALALACNLQRILHMSLRFRHLDLRHEHLAMCRCGLRACSCNFAHFLEILGVRRNFVCDTR